MGVHARVPSGAAGKHVVPLGQSPTPRPQIRVQIPLAQSPDAHASLASQRWPTIASTGAQTLTPPTAVHSRPVVHGSAASQVDVQNDISPCAAQTPL